MVNCRCLLRRIIDLYDLAPNLDPLGMLETDRMLIRAEARMKSYQVMPDCSLAFRVIATSSEPRVHRAGRASRTGFKSVRSSIAARVLESGLYLRKYPGSYRLEGHEFCISRCQRKPNRFLLLQKRNIRIRLHVSASLTLRVGT